MLTLSKYSCEEPFREDYFFKTNKENRESQLREIQTKFYNISKILDCISCEKCRLNGKVQIRGLGTALKILFQNTSTSAETAMIGSTHVLS
jgi:hypothetical protein